MAKLKDVFVAGGMPILTYVDRNHLKLEEKLREELNEGYKIIAITGPTKSGKTVLCKRVIDSINRIWIDGGQIENSDDFWDAITKQISLPTETSETQSAEVSGGWSLAVRVQGQFSGSETKKFSGPNKKQLLEHLREKGLTLIIDDFHYMPVELRGEVVRSLKSEIFNGLAVVVIAVPHRVFDAITAEREMEGRYAHVKIPPWDIDELKLIPNVGFQKLNMSVAGHDVQSLCDEALQSPLLIQRFCAKLCSHFLVTETLPQLTSFSPSNEKLKEIYSDVAQQFGYPTYESLALGPQSRSKRNKRELKDSTGYVDIYKAILMAVSLTGSKSKIHYDEIRGKLKDLLKEIDIPQKHEVSAALRHMEEIARTKIKGEPVLEWDKDFLYITDPFLRFFMRWSDLKELKI